LPASLKREIETAVHEPAGGHPKTIKMPAFDADLVAIGVGIGIGIGSDDRRLR
jgi:hypothetical protein